MAPFPFLVGKTAANQDIQKSWIWSDSSQGKKNQKKNFNNVSRFHFYALTTSIQTFQMHVSFMSLFSNDLILFANLGHTVDGNSCAGIDQGRYYQLLAKTAQLAKRNNYFDPVLWNTRTKSERWMNNPSGGYRCECQRISPQLRELRELI